MKKAVMPIALSVTIMSQSVSSVVYAHDNKVNTDGDIIELQEVGQVINIVDKNLMAGISSELQENDSYDIEKFENIASDTLDSQESKTNKEQVITESKDDKTVVTISTEGIHNELEQNDSSNIGDLENIALDMLDSQEKETNIGEDIIELKDLNEVVNIPDENLRKAINNNLGQSDTSDITIGQLESIRYLYLYRNNIENIEGIQYCINLVELSLSENEIKDISALSSLTNLEGLSLDGNKISDISALSSLTNLEGLYLSGNKISDISTLSSLTNLEGLDLSENEISDISALSSLINLEGLTLSGNEISDISALSSLINLIFLELNKSEISDISALSSLTNLYYLHLSENKISDISALSSLINLNELSLDGNEISNISALSNLIDLRLLDLHKNEISNISALSSLTSPEVLYLGENKISDISALSSLTSLDVLYLEENEVNDISALASLTNLYKLSLNKNKITDLRPLSDICKYLAELSIYGQKVDLGTLEIKDNKVEMQIPNIYDINGNLIKIPVEYFGSEDYEVYEDKVVWSNIENNNSFGMKFKSNINTGNENINYDVTFTQKAVKKPIINEKPVITANDIVIKVGDKFDPLKVVNISDKEDTDIISKLIVKENTVDISKPGVYKVLYEVTDSDGNTETKEIKVSVLSNNVSDTIMNIIDTNIVTPVSGDGSYNSPLVLEIKDIKEDDFTSFIENLSILNSKVVDITEDEKFIIFKIKTSNVSNTRLLVKSTDNYIELKIDKKLPNASKYKKIVKNTLNIEEINNIPTILVDDVTIKIGDKFDPLSIVTAHDKEDGDITSKIIVKTNTVDTSKEGEYKVIYEVTDNNGNTVIKEIKVTVIKQNLDTNDTNNGKNDNDGSNESNTQSNPTTGDTGILGYLGVAGTSLVTLLRKNKNKRK